MPGTPEGMASGAPSPLCPRDRIALTAIDSGVAGSLCSACDGLFLRSPEIAAAIRQAGIDRDKLGGIHALPPACPGCEAEMSVFIVASLEIDLCHFCEAVWLDKGELDKVNAYLAADPSRNADTRRLASAEDFGIFGGFAAAQTEAFVENASNEALFDILDAFQRSIRRSTL